MHQLLEKAIKKARTLPESEQGDLGQAFLALLAARHTDTPSATLSPRQVTEVERRIREPAIYATDEQVAHLFQKIGV